MHRFLVHPGYEVQYDAWTPQELPPTMDDDTGVRIGYRSYITGLRDELSRETGRLTVLYEPFREAETQAFLSDMLSIETYDDFFPTQLDFSPSIGGNNATGYLRTTDKTVLRDAWTTTPPETVIVHGEATGYCLADTLEDLSQIADDVNGVAPAPGVTWP